MCGRGDPLGSSCGKSRRFASERDETVSILPAFGTVEADAQHLHQEQVMATSAGMQHDGHFAIETSVMTK
jgi:hypothetical protein